MSAQIFTTCFRNRNVSNAIYNAPNAPDGFDDNIWKCAKGIASVMRANKIKCQVVRGNGSTSPSGARNATNYFIIEKDSKSNQIYMSFDMTEENANNIVKVFKDNNIPFVWGGTVGECFIITVDREGFPE